jgi:hypothetical protein
MPAYSDDIGDGLTWYERVMLQMGWTPVVDGHVDENNMIHSNAKVKAWTVTLHDTGETITIPVKLVTTYLNKNKPNGYEEFWKLCGYVSPYNNGKWASVTTGNTVYTTAQLEQRYKVHLSTFKNPMDYTIEMYDVHVKRKVRGVSKMVLMYVKNF